MFEAAKGVFHFGVNLRLAGDPIYSYNPPTMTEEVDTSGLDFIRTIITEDRVSGKYNGRVHTRFPPEPNGHLHIGHAKSICLNFGVAEEFGGLTNLRFDDTNPLKEEQEYVDAIMADIHWLGFDWEERLYFASDYFDQLYDFALQLIKGGKAYVDDLTAEEIREYRGTLTQPGKNSPYHDRSIDENLDLFERMKAGEFPDGARVLRAKIDMTSPNINMRDPVLYRILHASHHRTGDKWCIYPMYDWAHGQSDSIERITHSLCTLEFEDHRPLYNWFIEQLGIYQPRQIEFARLNLDYTIMSKRHLNRLVQDGFVNSWDDPRMPTLSGMRRRGYTPAAIHNFCDRIGVAKANSIVELQMLEHAVREDLNLHAPRAMGVLKPLRLVIENYPENRVEEFEVPTHPQDKTNTETHIVPFSRELYIEQEDFMEDPPGKYFRLAPGKEVRLLGAYYVTCTDVIKNEAGQVVEVRCTYDPDSRGGRSADNRKVKGTVHWLSAPHAIPAEARLYDTLFTKADPNDAPEGQGFTANINPNSLEVVNIYVEPDLAQAKVGNSYQFMRQGYFALDPDSTAEKLVFNRTITLRDSWAKLQQ
jgi:glutaminyl-tRNA synthetase